MAPERENTRHNRQRLWKWLFVAALLHSYALGVVGLVVYFRLPRDADLAAQEAQRRADGLDGVEVTSVDDDTARKIVAELERRQEEAEQEQIKKEVEQKEAPGQVVDLPRPREEKRPDSARFAAEYDSSVAKETKRYGQFDQQARQGDQAGESDVSHPPASSSPAAQPSAAAKAATKNAQPGRLAMRTPGLPGHPAGPSSPGIPGTAPGVGGGAEDLNAPTEAGGELGQAGQFVPQRNGGGGVPRSAPNASPNQPALLPNEQQIARAIGSGTQDHLRDVDEGDETGLNAKKWKFASFFNRVKQQVREHWKPADVYRRRDPSGAIYGSKDRYTLVRVQLKPDGSLANVMLDTPSGIEFLDDEAVEAFKQAQPFPNPPQQLVESSGMINFNFGFFFEISGAPKMKIFRYNSM